MHPIARERLTGSRFRLRNLVFVMRKDQVLAAKMDIQRVAEILHRHSGAFNVPARAPRPNLRFPFCLPRLWRLP